MPHQHQLVGNEPRAPQHPEIQTTTAVYYITKPNPAGPAAGYATPAPAPSVSYRNGQPLAGSRAPPHPSPQPKPVYHAPPRQNRPDPQQHPTAGGKEHHHASHGNPAIKEPAANGHRHHKGTPLMKHPAPSTPGATKIAPVLSPTAHNDKNAAGLHKTTQDQGMSSGAKAGLAIGLLLAFALIGAIIFLVYRRKKNQNAAHQPLDDEKTNLQKSQRSISSHVSVRRTVANAPRLSLRPVTEMFPAMSEKSDNASASTFIAKSAASARAKTPEPMTAEGAANPFGDHAAALDNSDQTNLTVPAAIVPKPLSVKSERTGSGLSDRSPPSSGQASATSGVAPVARRLSPPGPGPNNVHRVQLDFNPSMDDELGLRAGQLVRMLHEYDDGWALCIRLDRSQQGVVPRTCISKLPVKPRPQGPPTNMRGPPPQGRPRGPSNTPVPRGQPNDMRQRPMAPPNGRMRSQSNTPHQGRPQSPGPFGGQSAVSQSRPRASSDAMSARRITPPGVSPPSSASTSPTQGSSVPSRKPVPGQAL